MHVWVNINAQLLLRMHRDGVWEVTGTLARDQGPSSNLQSADCKAWHVLKQYEFCGFGSRIGFVELGNRVDPFISDIMDFFYSFS